MKPREGLRAPMGAAIILPLVCVSGFLLRFHRLTTLSVWPLLDESIHARIAWDMLWGWDGRLFHYVSQMPPLYFLLQAAVFKALGYGRTALWALPAALSFLTALVPLLWGSIPGRPRLARDAGVVLMLTFWPAYLGRFSHPAVLVPLFTVVGAVLLYEWKLRDEAIAWAAVLGAWVGLGFYTYLAWPAVAVAFALGVGMLGGTGRRLVNLAVFLAACTVVASPLVWEAARNGFGSYYAHLWSAGTPGWTPGVWVERSLAYLRVVFIGTGGRWFFYTPAWGGLLNPVVGVLACVGMYRCVRVWRSSPWIRWAIMSGVLFALPGVLSVSVNPLRTVALAPHLAVLACWGWDALRPRGGRGLFLLGALLVVSSAWDATHLFRKYPRLWEEGSPAWGEASKSFKFKKAGDALLEERAKNGPGFYLSGFQLEMVDQSLDLAASEISPLRTGAVPAWMAFTADQNYLPFLQARFENIRFYPLPREGAWDGGSALYVVPVKGHFDGKGAGASLGLWLYANKAWRDAVSLGLQRREGGSYLPSLKQVEETASLAKGDQFLASLNAEKAALLFGLDAAYGDGKRNDCLAGSLGALSEGVKEGYPAANLYYQLGSLNEAAGRKREAVRCYQVALEAPVNLTPAADALKRLKPKK